MKVFDSSCRVGFKEILVELGVTVFQTLGIGVSNADAGACLLAAFSLALSSLSSSLAKDLMIGFLATFTFELS